jgi:hypothetical protein
MTGRLLVCGSRDLIERSRTECAIDNALSSWQLTPSSLEFIISGGARGPDTLGEVWAQANGVTVKRFLPDWDQHGRRAGILRNLEMLDFIAQSPQPLVVAVWDGSSRGTGHTVGEARRRGFKVWVG